MTRLEVNYEKEYELDKLEKFILDMEEFDEVFIHIFEFCEFEEFDFQFKLLKYGPEKFIIYNLTDNMDNKLIIDFDRLSIDQVFSLIRYGYYYGEK